MGAVCQIERKFGSFDRFGFETDNYFSMMIMGNP